MTPTENEIARVSAECLAILPLEDITLGDEYGYTCLPLCVIDAVWSIGVRYAGVQNVISRYCAYFGIPSGNGTQPHCVRDLFASMQDKGAEWFAANVFQNAQRTSTRNGILKAEAVYRFAEVLNRHGIDTLDDVPKIGWYDELTQEMRQPYAQEILAIPGQKSGVSLSYFYMLTGSTGIVKPDRMVFRFLMEILDRSLTDDDAQYLLCHVSRELNAAYPLLTPRSLDHLIWKHQSGRMVSQ